jgi:hypothetical protein
MCGCNNHHLLFWCVVLGILIITFEKELHEYVGLLGEYLSSPIRRQRRLLPIQTTFSVGIEFLAYHHNMYVFEVKKIVAIDSYVTGLKFTVVIINVTRQKN